MELKLRPAIRERGDVGSSPHDFIKTYDILHYYHDYLLINDCLTYYFSVSSRNRLPAVSALPFYGQNLDMNVEVCTLHLYNLMQILIYMIYQIHTTI